jgi:hypothetical protein
MDEAYTFHFPREGVLATSAFRLMCKNYVEENFPRATWWLTGLGPQLNLHFISEEYYDKFINGLKELTQAINTKSYEEPKAKDRYSIDYEHGFASGGPGGGAGGGSPTYVLPKGVDHVVISSGGSGYSPPPVVTLGPSVPQTTILNDIIKQGASKFGTQLSEDLVNHALSVLGEMLQEPTPAPEEKKPELTWWQKVLKGKKNGTKNNNG